MKNTKLHTWPLIKKTRYGKVSIYRQARGERESYTVSYQLGKKRIRETISKPEDAIERAALVLASFEKGEVPKLALKSVDKWKSVVGDVPMEEILRCYAEQHDLLPSVSVQQAIDEFLLVKRHDGLKKHTYSTIKSQLGKFAESCGSSLIKNLTTDDLNTCLRSVPDMRYRHNRRANIKALFRWALTKNYVRYVPQYNGTVAEGTQAISRKHFQKTPCIYTPEELKQLFDASHWSMIPWLIAANYSGIRKAEIARLRWDNIDWDEGAFVLQTEITKTSNRRIAYFPPDVKEGLKKIAVIAKLNNKTKLVHGDIDKLVAKLRNDAKVPWKQNGHRKSYITYAMALTRNSAEIAEQCGNSAQEIQRTYKGLASKKVAEEWFKVINTSAMESKFY